MFTWIPIYKELAQKIIKYENRQTELLDILKKAQEQGLKTISLKDKGIGGVDTELKEIDPFTFFATFNRGLTDANRKAILKFLKDYISLTSNVPEDFNGIPIVPPNKSWFFAYGKDRAENDIELLWKLAIHAIKTNSIDKALFDDCLNIQEVGLPLLTMGLFWIAPYSFLPADGNTRAYLKENGIEMEKWDYDNYVEFLETAKKVLGDNFPKISYDAWLKNVPPLPPKSIRYWQIAPGDRARLWPIMSKEGYIAVGWNGTPDLSDIATEEELFSMLQEFGQGETKQKTQTHQLWNFLKNTKIGDMIIANHGKKIIVGVGKISGDYYYNGSISEYRHCKKVNWEWMGEKEISMQNKFGKTIAELSKEEFEELVKGLPLKAQINGGTDQTEAYSLKDWIKDTGFDEETLRKWKKAIERKGQVIFYGPPGTGKTFIAECFAKYLASESDGCYDVLQFHPAYNYEDFIEGIRPLVSKDDKGKLEYPMVPGRFLDFCKKAQERKGLSILIIDEINRANLSRVFGELMYLLEYRDRDIPLAGGTKFKIPKNVRVIGTMNTADRSIALVDYALRRRFAFLKLYPKYDILEQYHNKGNFPVNNLIEILKWINKQINDQNYEIGITFFLHKELNQHIEDIWRMEIEPYLEEYFFDQADKVNKFRWDNVKEKMFKTQ